MSEVKGNKNFSNTPTVLGASVALVTDVTEDYILIRDEKASGVNAGTFTQSVYRTRDLNTEVIDTGGNATLAANQITLLAGTYRFKIRCPAFSVGRHKTRLQNITDVTTIDIGSSESGFSTSFVSNHSFLSGRFTISASKIFEIQHRCAVTKTNDGFGVSVSFGDIEIYTVAEFWREL